MMLMSIFYKSWRVTFDNDLSYLSAVDYAY